MLKIWEPELPATAEDRPLLRRRLMQVETPRPMVIVCPGGGYTHLAPHEALNVAERCNQAGFHAAVLYYRLAPDHQHPAMIHDVQRAVRLVRRHARQWGVSDKVAVLGFSAGGHLASCAATLYDQFTSADDDLAEHYSARPDAVVLCYPVLDLTDPGIRHTGSRDALLREQREDAQSTAALSTPSQVNDRTPPCFLWHTADDPAVHVEHSLRFTSACREHHVPVELHVYESGRHGIGLADDHAEARTWFDFAQAFLHRHLD